jgi:hypothetical protein
MTGDLLEKHFSMGISMATCTLEYIVLTMSRCLSSFSFVLITHEV